MVKPMLLTDSDEIPIGEEWIYETKYDGYRCLLYWEKNESVPTLMSRNNNQLNEKFPEIVAYCKGIYKEIQPYLPLVLDGEIVHLTNNFQSNFSVVQKRGKMRKSESIEKQAQSFPCHYIVFDLVRINDIAQTEKDLMARKKILEKLFKSLHLPIKIDYTSLKRLQAIDMSEDSDQLWESVRSYNGEGIIAKKRKSLWVENVRTQNWLKIKNWRFVNVILTRFNQTNGFFDGAVYMKNKLVDVVTFKHGLQQEEAETLMTLFQNNGTLIKKGLYEIPPSICVTVACIDFDGSKLREPRFHTFQHHLNGTDCNWQTMQRQLHPIPDHITITHPDKPVFPTSSITKDDYLLYLQQAAPFSLPFLHNRLLTVIRYPHGVPGESFYQKNSPEYTPDYVRTHLIDDTNFILCNNIDTLLWLGNQLAIEFHIPFQPYHFSKPTEIVFDLDPPSVKEFPLAINAALKLKTILDHFELHSFVKTSGGKGMQIYIPLPENTYSYEETSAFAEFICTFLVQQYPDLFTIERLKKNRKNRLYLDFVQFKEGKTIVAPYSVRGNEKGIVATPLYWEEVNEQLTPDRFTIAYVMERIREVGDPFKSFREVAKTQDFASVLNQLNREADG